MSLPSDPVPQLDRQARDLLQAFRAEEDLPGDVSDRVLQRLEESGALAAPPAEASDVVVRGRWWIPATAVVLAAAAAVLLWRADMFSATQDPAHEPVQARDLAETSSAQPGVSKRGQPLPRARDGRTTTATPPRDVTPDTAPDTAPADPTQAKGPAPATSSPATSRPRRDKTDEVATPSPEVSASSLAEETRLLAKAQAAVAAGRYADALETIATSKQRFPAGLLEEERAALRAIALCESDAAGAQRSAAAFAKGHPASALRTRVENACAER